MAKLSSHMIHHLLVQWFDIYMLKCRNKAHSLLGLEQTTSKFSICSPYQKSKLEFVIKMLLDFTSCVHEYDHMGQLSVMITSRVTKLCTIYCSNWKESSLILCLCPLTFLLLDDCSVLLAVLCFVCQLKAFLSAFLGKTFMWSLIG